MQDNPLHHDPNFYQEHAETPKAPRLLPLSLITGLSAVVLIASGATAWWTWQSSSHNRTTERTAPTAVEPTQPRELPAQSEHPAPTTSTTSPDRAVPQTTHQPESRTAQATTEQTARIYWLRDANNRLELVPSTVSLNTNTEPDAILTAAFGQLLEGPTDTAVASTIPEGTTLRSVEVRQDGVHVDLSQQFTTGGGSASMTGRLGQVIYTATTLDPDARVWVSVEGQPLEVLGGEGVLVEQPMTRQAVSKDFSLN